MRTPALTLLMLVIAATPAALAENACVRNVCHESLTTDAGEGTCSYSTGSYEHARHDWANASRVSLHAAQSCGATSTATAAERHSAQTASASAGERSLELNHGAQTGYDENGNIDSCHASARTTHRAVDLPCVPGATLPGDALQLLP